MNRLWMIVVAVAIALCPEIGQSDWVGNCTGNTGSVTNLEPPGIVACHNPQSANDDPSLLRVAGCENIDVGWYDNVDGTGGGDADATATVYHCPSVAATATDTEAERELACQPYTNGSLTNTVSELQGAGMPVIWVDIELASTENQLVVRCSQPSEKQ